MGEQRNLTEDNVEQLTRVLDGMKEENKELEYKFFQQEKAESLDQQSEKEDQPTNNMIYKKLETIERTLDRIFGDHVVVDGQFMAVKGIARNV